jgi:hypothetical protein
LKSKFFILPVVSLLLIAGWIGSGRRSISLLEEESALLKQALAARAFSSGADTADSKSPDQLGKEKEPIDWKKIAAQMEEIQKSAELGDFVSFERLKKKFNALSKEELVSALEEIATLDLPDESLLILQQMLLRPLCDKDPEYALKRYFGRMDDQRGNLNGVLAGAMKDWASNDPAAAIAWFDQQIAAGKFDGKSLDGESYTRIQFEGQLLKALFPTDPAAAASRLKSIPENQRAESLRSGGNSLEDKDQLAYANLIRNVLPAKAQAETFILHITYKLDGGGPNKITEYLDRIKATPAERAICVEHLVESKIQELSRNRKVTREDLDAMREWTTSQAPGTTDKVTGVALANSTQGTQKLEFSEAAALATQYHEASGNDDVLIGFLMAYDPDKGSKEEARVLAQKISDVKKREEILNRFN